MDTLGFRKSFTFTLTVSTYDLTVVAVMLLHLCIGLTSFNLVPIGEGSGDGSIVGGDVIETKQEINIPVKLRWAISKEARASRFGKYIEKMKDSEFSSEVAENNYTEELDQKTLGEVKKLGLTKSQMNEIAKENKVIYEENVNLLRDLLQKNQKKYQTCYEKALLKDDLMSGVSGLVLTVHNGILNNVDTTFKGDGHKEAVDTLGKCLVERSHSLNLKHISGSHKIKFNLVFKS